MNTQLVTVDPPRPELPAMTVQLGTLQASTPQALIQSATAVATPLAALIDKQKLFSVISGRKYVRVEGWTTLAIMLGVVPREVSCSDQDGIYTAVVELVRMNDGAVISRASAECGEEKPWCERPRYARHSMAVTRATGKACRIAFSWIMTLAGYEATPAEEMEPIDYARAYPEQAPRRQFAPAPAALPATNRIGLDSVDARTLADGIAQLDIDAARLLAWTQKKYKVTGFGDLTNAQCEDLIKRLPKFAEIPQKDASEALDPHIGEYSVEDLLLMATETREAAEHCDDPATRKLDLARARSYEKRAKDLADANA